MRSKYIKKLVELLILNDIDAILIAPSDDMRFLTGHSPYLCERFQGLVIKNDYKCFYICNLLTSDEVKKAFDGEIKIYSWFDGDKYTDTVKKAFEQHELLGKKIAINLSVRGLDMIEIAKETGVEFVNGKTVLEELKIIKTDFEIRNMKESSKIADEVLGELIKIIQPGMTEKEIKKLMFKEFTKKGAESSYGLISCGVNTAYPHYSDVTGTIKENDIVIFDIGCVYNEMCSDMTRTIFIGDATEEQKIIYNIVLKANVCAEKIIKPNIYIPDIDYEARNVIEKNGYSKYFTTRLGHGIGYAVHEAPDIKKSNCGYLKEGMLFSIEPGIYIPEKFGVRIEDVVLVTANESEILNKFDKSIIIVR